MKINSFLIGTCLILTSCGANIAVKPELGMNQKSMFVEGQEHVVSKQNNLVRVGFRESRLNLALEMELYVKNMEQKELNLDPRNISVVASTGQQLKVYTPNEVEGIVSDHRFLFSSGDDLIMDSTYSDILKTVKETYIRRHTIMPGQEHTCCFMVRLPKKAKNFPRKVFVKISLPETGEVHEFTFNTAKS